MISQSFTVADIHTYLLTVQWDWTAWPSLKVTCSHVPPGLWTPCFLSLGFFSLPSLRVFCSRSTVPSLWACPPHPRWCQSLPPPCLNMAVITCSAIVCLIICLFPPVTHSWRWGLCLTAWAGVATQWTLAKWMKEGMYPCPSMCHHLSLLVGWRLKEEETDFLYIL